MPSRHATEENLWPSPEYHQWVQKLYQALGQTIFLTEIDMTAINAGVHWSDQPLRLLNIVTYPEPDPYRQLYPHLIIVDDGRGINLGRIARISLQQAFLPKTEDILYENKTFLQEQLYAPRRLSRDLLIQTTKNLLSDMFGSEPGQLLASLEQSERPTVQLENSQVRPEQNKKLR